VREIVRRCRAEDLVGNRINVKFTQNGQTPTDNLHAVWDGVIMRRGGITTLADADALYAEITATEAAQFATLAIVDWATEAHVIARTLAYTKPDGTAVAENDFLDDAYFVPAIDAVKLQLKKAGVRLATLIEAAAGGTMPEHLLAVTP
jgi:S1/P1 Nuclease